MKSVIPPKAAVPRSHKTTVGAIRGSISQAWKAVVTRIFVSYRPDLHYMRGPGPKWREGHGRPWEDLH